VADWALHKPNQKAGPQPFLAPTTPRRRNPFWTDARARTLGTSKRFIDAGRPSFMASLITASRNRMQALSLALSESAHVIAVATVAHVAPVAAAVAGGILKDPSAVIAAAPAQA
jgi:hypothetical protein